MIKFLLATRPKPDADEARFDYEWGIIHPSLMLTTASVVRTFHRYAQHRSVADAADVPLRIPAAPEGWRCMSDHWLEGFEQLGDIFTDQYMRRMHPHSFGDSQFVIELVEGHVLRDEPGRRGGVKVVTFGVARDGIDDDEVRRTMLGALAEAIEADDAHGIIRKHVVNTRLPIDPALFEGTLFERGGCGRHAVVEEVWFDSVDDARTFASEVFSTSHAVRERVIDPKQSFSMLLIERVLWDRTRPGFPEPGILRIDSFESYVVGTEREAGDWHTPEAPRFDVPPQLASLSDDVNR